jgi:protein-S-isoprenylcysteine O-methyltransferase Ste14
MIKPSWLGLIFLVVGVVYALVARGAFVTAKREWTSAARTYRLLAVIFAVVGVGLLLWQVALR